MESSGTGLAARCGVAGRLRSQTTAETLRSQWKFFGFGDFHDPEADNFLNLISFSLPLSKDTSSVQFS